MSVITNLDVLATCDPHIVIISNALTFLSILAIGWSWGFGTREIINWIKALWGRWKK
jgi:hypothetical protein